jgi:predicted nucleic acid-binding protein
MDRETQYVSVITLAEIQKGIEILAPGKRRAPLEEWLARDLEAWFSGPELLVDRQVSARWASLLARATRTRRPLPAIDSLIAATALAYELTIVTRNTKDFEGIGASTFNPWNAISLFLIACSADTSRPLPAISSVRISLSRLPKSRPAAQSVQSRQCPIAFSGSCVYKETMDASIYFGENILAHLRERRRMLR